MRVRYHIKESSTPINGNEKNMRIILPSQLKGFILISYLIIILNSAENTNCH